jgi:hypothetical protein
MGLYGMCFVYMAVLNNKLASFNNYTGKIPYILDTGNAKKHQVVNAHGEISKMQKEEQDFFWNAGGLHFEDDRDFALLQAADLVAWGARRKEDQKRFPNGMEPINRLLSDELFHVSKHFEASLMKEWNDRIMESHRKRLSELSKREVFDDGE